jgi:hypothetical protein
MRSAVNGRAGTFVPMIAAGSGAEETKTASATARADLEEDEEKEGFIVLNTLAPLMVEFQSSFRCLRRT